MMIVGLSADLGNKCSRAECRQAATWRVSWRNPRIHDASRVKVWLACDEHEPYLRDYLANRGFPVRVTPLGVAVDSTELVGHADLAGNPE